MASFKKRVNSWRADVNRLGVRKTATFDTLAQAKTWALHEESRILSTSGRERVGAKTTILLRAALGLFMQDVLPSRKSYKKEKAGLNSIIKNDIAGIMAKRLVSITKQDIKRYRDVRLTQVQGSTVNRELNILSTFFQHCVEEREWLKENPVRQVKRPPNPPPRVRRISDDEVRLIQSALGTCEDTPTTTKALVGLMMELAIESGMRLGEICSLRASNVHARHVHLSETKNGRARDVPLSDRACVLVNRQLQSGITVSAEFASATFRVARMSVDIHDLHFHDTRHEAVTRLSRKLDVLELARVIGHNDIKSLMIYYNATVDELADKLAG